MNHLKRADVCQQQTSTGAIAAAILRYIKAHPDACDTLQGVSEWWLARQRYEDTRRRVRAALQLLLDQGKAEAIPGADGHTLYRAAARGRR